jgi:hypothetical protein
LTWKLFGKRLDGFHNDDHPSEAKPGDGENLLHQGNKVDLQKNKAKFDIDYTGSVMPPPDAVKAGKVKPLSDENRRTIVRWIDLGCPIDLDHDIEAADRRGRGWMLDDNRPTLTLATPAAGANDSITRLLVGMHDYYTGLDAGSFRVTADFSIDGAPAGENLAPAFRSTSQGVWEYRLKEPIAKLPRGMITVAVKDREGNWTKIERTLWMK